MGWNDGRLSPQSTLLADDEVVKRSGGTLIDLDTGAAPNDDFHLAKGSSYVPPSLQIPDLEVNNDKGEAVDTVAVNDLAPKDSSVKKNPNGQEIEKLNLFLKEKFSQAGSYCVEKSEMLRARAQQGPLPLSVFAFFGGCAMVFVNVHALLIDFFHLQLLHMLESAYCLLFGLTICLLEGKMWSCPSEPLPALFANAKFLKYVWGRGAFYIFVGTMQCFKRSMLDFLIGGFLMVIGLILLIDGRIAAKKLSAAKLPSREALIDIFVANDGDKDGALEYVEFGNFLTALGVELTARELELACFAVDQDGDEKISEEELVSWWESFHGVAIGNNASFSV